MSNALSTDLRRYATKRWPTMNHEWRKAKIASMLGMKVRRVRSYWDGEENLSARVDEVEAFRALMNQSYSELQRGNQDAFAELQARIARLEALLLSEEESRIEPTNDDAGHRNYGRRRTDVARTIDFTNASETADQSQGWGI